MIIIIRKKYSPVVKNLKTWGFSLWVVIKVAFWPDMLLSQIILAALAVPVLCCSHPGSNFRSKISPFWRAGHSRHKSNRYVVDHYELTTIRPTNQSVQNSAQQTCKQQTDKLTRSHIITDVVSDKYGTGIEITVCFCVTGSVCCFMGLAV